MAAAQLELPLSSAEETTYRCPKCKRQVIVLVAHALVTCSRCGREMKRVPQPPA